MEAETKWLPSYLFVRKLPDSHPEQMVEVVSSDSNRLNALSRDDDFKAFRVVWARLSGYAYAPHHWVAVDQPVGQEFVLRHWEPPRSSFSEGDYLAGPFQSGLVPSECGSGFQYWERHGVGTDGDFIGLLHPLGPAA